MYFLHIDFLIILLLAGFVYRLITDGVHRSAKPMTNLSGLIVGLSGTLALADSHWLQMIWLFLKTGLFSFGGAYASLAFIQNGAVDQYHWLTASQLLDGVALSVATPGPFMLFTTFVGYLAGGVPGALLATFFVFLPSFIFIILGARYIEQVRNNRFVQAFLSGVSAAVVGVIIVVSLALIPGALVDLWSIVIMMLAFAVITFLKVDVARVAIGAIVIGMAYAAWNAFQ